jgi:hypothetical protein
MGVKGEIVEVAGVPLTFGPGTDIVVPSEFTKVIGFLEDIVEVPSPAGSEADSENMTDCGPPLKSAVEGGVSPV